MAQGLFGGATSYDMQSDQDILHDISNWIECSIEVDEFVNKYLKVLKSNGYWKKIDYDFGMLISDFILFNKTVISDLEQVKNAIENKCISSREVTLLKAIGSKASILNNDIGICYYKDGKWHDYSNQNFELVEKIYEKSRNHCVDIMDAGNAASRLKDYIIDTSINNININGNILGNQVQIGTINSNLVDNSSSINYEVICDTLQKIKEITEDKSFSIEFADFSEKFKNILTEAIVEANKKQHQDTRLLNNKFETLKSILLGIPSGIIANKISDILNKLFLLIKN